MLFNIKPYELKVFELIQLCARELGYPVYVVGGYVRDRLLDRPSNDMDIVCVGDGIRLAENVASKLKPIPRIVVYKRFGTAMIRHNDMVIEFVGARKESYRHDSRKPDIYEGSLEDDQHRRDFTINALAVSLNEENYGEIIDPFNGLLHLEEKLIKTPLEPGKTFSDDPLRILRAIRFANQLDFTIHPETMEAIYVFRNRIHIVSKERICMELEKILRTDTPSVGFLMLFNTGLLDIILPELTRLKGVEIRNGIAHKDNFYHTLAVLDNLAKTSDNVWLRWAALLHDIAKPHTKRFERKAGWTFHGHEAVGAVMVPRIFKKLRLSLDNKMKYVQKMVKLHLRPISLTKENITDSAIRRLLFDAGNDIDDLMLLCKADITSKNERKKARFLSNYEIVKQKLKELEERDRIKNWQPPVSGEVIMDTFGIGPCREVGVIKNAIREAILDGLIDNNYEDAFSFMIEKAVEIGLKPVKKKI